MPDAQACDKQAISIQQLAQQWGVSTRTALRLIETGDLKAHRIGRQWRVFEPDLKDYLARQANRQTCRHRGAGCRAE